MDTFFKLLSTLGLTILIEYPIVQAMWLILKFDKAESKKSHIVFYKNKIIIIPALIVNVLTNPAINIFARYLVMNTNINNKMFWGIITILEVIIWIIEGALYKFLLKTKWSNAFLLAVSANFVSYLSSFLL